MPIEIINTTPAAAARPARLGEYRDAVGMTVPPDERVPGPYLVRLLNAFAFDGSEAQDQLNLLAAHGYRLVGLAQSENGAAAILEKQKGK